jgi:tetratricopeptide (TPR) repeat protein
MTFTKGLTVLMLFALSPATILAQGKVADSLEQKLTTVEGQIRVDILNQLAYEFITVDNEKVVRYSNEGLQLAKSINYIKGEGIAYSYRGVYEYMSGQFASARQKLHTGLRLSTQAGDSNNIGYTFLQLGVCGLEEVNTDSAYHYFRKAHTIFKDSTNPESLSKVYRNMSALFGQRFQQDSQQFYLGKAIELQPVILLPQKNFCRKQNRSLKDIQKTLRT